jgi:phosphoribosylformylglycinamidine synthase I
MLGEAQILAIPGGFSYGDDISSGKIFANQLRMHLADALRDFVAAGKPIIGICNGFQILVKAGLLPGPMDGPPAATLTHNDCHRFVDRWIHLKPVSKKCIWLTDCVPLSLPIAHGEGKFVPASEPARRMLWELDQVALGYVHADGTPALGEFPDNPNGSVDDIAGICDSTGLVLGLMPHPERYVDPRQHPAWTSQSPLPAVGAGLAIFQSAINYVGHGVS